MRHLPSVTLRPHCGLDISCRAQFWLRFKAFRGEIIFVQVSCPGFSTKVREGVYITAAGCETEFVEARGL